MEKENKPFPYEDILHLPHPVSARHRPMPIADRAAQFAPFAALTGYGDVIDETGRLTDKKPVLNEDAKALLDRKLAALLAASVYEPLCEITYFAADDRKDGGSLRQARGVINAVDRVGRRLIMTDKREILLDDIIAIDAGLFATAEEQ